MRVLRSLNLGWRVCCRRRWQHWERWEGALEASRVPCTLLPEGRNSRTLEVSQDGAYCVHCNRCLWNVIRWFHRRWQSCGLRGWRARTWQRRGAIVVRWPTLRSHKEGKSAIWWILWCGFAVEPGWGVVGGIAPKPDDGFENGSRDVFIDSDEHTRATDLHRNASTGGKSND